MLLIPLDRSVHPVLGSCYFIEGQKWLELVRFFLKNI